MKTVIKASFTTLTIILLFGFYANTAAAAHLRFSERNFEFIWEHGLSAPKGPWTVEAAGNRTVCDVTLLGSFEGTTIAKQTSSRIGLINHATVSNCNEGILVPLVETLPWSAFYVGFSGTLPNITDTRLSVVGAAFADTTSGGVRCLARTERNHPVVFELEGFSGGAPESIRVDETRGIPLGGEEFICGFAGEAHIRGLGLVRNLPGTRLVTVTLI